MNHFYSTFSKSVFDAVCASTPFALQHLSEESNGEVLHNIKVGYATDHVPPLSPIPVVYSEAVRQYSSYIADSINLLIFEELSKKKALSIRDNTPDAEESLGAIIADSGCDVLIADTQTFSSIFGDDVKTVARLVVEVSIRFGISVFLVDSNEHTKDRVFLFKSQNLKDCIFGLGVVTESIVQELVDGNQPVGSYHTAYYTSNPDRTELSLWFAMRGKPVINDDTYVVVTTA